MRKNLEKNKQKRVSELIDLSDNPRITALVVLEGADGTFPPEEILAQKGLLLSERDMSLAQALVYACLRHQSRLDFLLDQKLKKDTSGRCRIILRLGLAQLMFFDRLGDHAVVNETVNLAKKFAPGREGLVNAILREFTRERQGDGEAFFWPIENDGRDRELSLRLATFYSHPKWLVERYIKELGLSGTRAILAANNRPVPPTIRVNPQKIGRQELTELLPFLVRKTILSPWGLVPDSFVRRPDSWPGFSKGFFFLQDEASQLLGLLVQEPKKVLDACAGLGGKSLALATLYPEARITSVDRSGPRLALLEKESRRLGCRRIEIIVDDIYNVGITQDFDLVLVDAPCSGLGVIRRRPDVKWRKIEGDSFRLSDSQFKLLSQAANFVAPGGQLIYSVCSPFFEEGPGVISRFIEENPKFKPFELSAIPKELHSLVSGPGEIRLWPHKSGTDGFFYGLLTRV